MARTKFYKGTKAKVDAKAIEDGAIYVTTDTQELFVDAGIARLEIGKGITYTLSKSGSNITLTGSDGSTTSVVDSNTTYALATASANGLLSSADKTKLDGIAAGANKYTLPTATDTVLGGVKTGSNITNTSGPISITKANVTAALGYTPSTADTNTWTAFQGATTSAAGTAGYMPAPVAGAANKYFRSEGTWTVPPDTNTTYTASTGLILSGTAFSITAGGITATQLARGSVTDAKLGSDVGTIAVQSATPTSDNVKLWIKI